MNIALPRKGFNGADSTDDNTAWKNSMAESEVKYVKEASRQQQPDDSRQKMVIKERVLHVCASWTNTIFCWRFHTLWLNTWLKVSTGHLGEHWPLSSVMPKKTLHLSVTKEQVRFQTHYTLLLTISKLTYHFINSWDWKDKIKAIFVLNSEIRDKRC